MPGLLWLDCSPIPLGHPHECREAPFSAIVHTPWSYPWIIGPGRPSAAPGWTHRLCWSAGPSTVAECPANPGSAPPVALWAGVVDASPFPRHPP